MLKSCHRKLGVDGRNKRRTEEELNEIIGTTKLKNLLDSDMQGLKISLVTFMLHIMSITLKVLFMENLM